MSLLTKYLSINSQIIYYIHNNKRTREALADVLVMSRMLSGRHINELITNKFVIESDNLFCPRCGKSIEGLKGNEVLNLTDTGIEEYKQIEKILNSLKAK